MKINLPFPPHSVVKVITDSCLLILIISAVHIVSVFSTFDSHLHNIKIIDKLTTLKISTSELIYSSQSSPHQLAGVVQKIDEQLATQSLFTSSWFNTQKINEENQNLLNQWAQIHASIEQHHLVTAHQQLTVFYTSLDKIVNQYQVLAAKKMDIIHVTEIINFLITILITVTLYLYAKKQIVKPIKQLVSNVTSIKEREFNVTFPNSKNEIGLLSQCIKDSADELRDVLEDMEHQVSEQTVALEKANQTIEFLYSISQQLSTVKLTSPILYNALNALAQQANLKKLSIELNNGTFINSRQGSACFSKKTTRIPIIISGKPYGFLNYILAEGAKDQHELIESFTGLVARALYQEEHSLQEQKILLMEERSIIARELHDSIAQSLSFLKIQCTLLHYQVNNNQLQQTQEVISNIEEGVSEAYVQLRSLLSTFRLNVTESNFKEAMTTMITTLQKQTAAVISIKKFDPHFTSEASQHIHLLQIVQEAIINAIKHSQCEHIDISCIITKQNKVWISVIDDGLGIINNGERSDHYGLTIMQQRADELNATLSFNSLTKGTEVKLIFPYKNPILNQGSTNV